MRLSWFSGSACHLRVISGVAGSCPPWCRVSRNREGRHELHTTCMTSAVEHQVAWKTGVLASVPELTGDRRQMAAFRLLGRKTQPSFWSVYRVHRFVLLSKESQASKAARQAPLGWHTLRRSLAISNGGNEKAVQSQLRHTTPKIKLELYALAVSADQQKAHRKVVRMVLPPKFP